MDWHTIQGRVEIFPVTSCYWNRDKLRPDGLSWLVCRLYLHKQEPQFIVFKRKILFQSKLWVNNNPQLPLVRCEANRIWCNLVWNPSHIGRYFHVINQFLDRVETSLLQNFMNTCIPLICTNLMEMMLQIMASMGFYQTKQKKKHERTWARFLFLDQQCYSMSTSNK